MSDAAPPPRLPAQVPAAETPGLNSLMTLAVSVVVVAALYLAREVLIPITVAILLSFVLRPLADLLRRLHLPHVAAVLLAVIIGIGTLLAIGSVIGVQVAGLATDIPQYAVTIEKKVETVPQRHRGPAGQPREPCGSADGAAKNRGAGRG